MAGIEKRARAAYPEEACGLLVGAVARSDGGAVLRNVFDAIPAANIATGSRRDRYAIDPGQIVLEDSRARAMGLAILGVWHSHPDRPATPSRRDIDAAWEDWSYLIVSLGLQAEKTRSWRILRGHAREEPLKSGATSGR